LWSTSHPTTISKVMDSLRGVELDAGEGHMCGAMASYRIRDVHSSHRS